MLVLPGLRAAHQYSSLPACENLALLSCALTLAFKMMTFTSLLIHINMYVNMITCYFLRSCCPLQCELVQRLIKFVGAILTVLFSCKLRSIFPYVAPGVDFQS